MIRIFFINIIILLSSFCSVAQSNSELSLNGNWQILFDPENIGIEANWMNPATFMKQDEVRIIQVPSCWEEVEKNYEGVAWYHKKFFTPEKWKGRSVYINFDAVNYVAELWLNNKVIDYHTGGFTPFSFRIDKSLKYGEENVITMRVVGPIILTDQRIDNMGRQETPQWRGGITGGIWQPVNITTNGAACIKDVFIETNIRKKTAAFTINFESVAINTSQVDAILKITSPEGEIVARKEARLTLSPGSNSMKWVLDIPDAQNWSLENPYLYQAKLQVKQQENVSDEWEHKFGLREFTVRDKKLKT